MTETINAWIDWLLQSLGLSGPSILFATVPLAVLQSLFGFFPLAILIVLHVSVFNVIGGMIVSWLACNIGAVLVYFLFRRYLSEWFDRKWGYKLKRYDKWQMYLDRYGIWTLVLLRTIPIVPSNIINLMSAVSPIKPAAFIWGTVLGNLSYIWLFGTISSSLIVPREEWNGFLTWYAVFMVILIAIFVRRHWGHLQEDKRKRMG
ncbi:MULTISPECIES: TVP38/TMEM64 family protein [Paenibacillus]|uniref:TVP38/TMEM64 family membrane protein n=1 Tax=Paenibacillus phytohabitans TaxID=2654978 RepID=A0ABX1YP82_9BACL|nr:MULTISPECIES: VTT domain-containing protein [unclassified Paenibacillus]AIQ32226.1 L-seryl-tRNA selenium transferase [Paenibacillus sp. FSL P4-0081]NOU82873.1 L-seryl-tRNA selenium transferase [Paenibacillus phytohabitans]OMF21015.1 L-seryl-tRNA selenium transferase [Paenibacillus sp. FSL H8-0259]